LERKPDTRSLEKLGGGDDDATATSLVIVVNTLDLLH
jgi:hypothetical protein